MGTVRLAFFTGLSFYVIGYYLYIQSCLRHLFNQLHYFEYSFYHYLCVLTYHCALLIGVHWHHHHHVNKDNCSLQLYYSYQWCVNSFTYLAALHHVVCLLVVVVAYTRAAVRVDSVNHANRWASWQVKKFQSVLVAALKRYTRWLACRLLLTQSVSDSGLQMDDSHISAECFVLPRVWFVEVAWRARCTLKITVRLSWVQFNLPHSPRWSSRFVADVVQFIFTYWPR